MHYSNGEFNRCLARFGLMVLSVIRNVLSAISIIVQGKEFDITLSPCVWYLELADLSVSPFLVPAYSTNAILSRTMCASNYAGRKGSKQNMRYLPNRFLHGSKLMPTLKN